MSAEIHISAVLSGKQSLLARLHAVFSTDVSDIHLSAGSGLAIRVLGKMVSVTDEPVSDAVLRALIQDWLTPQQWAQWQTEKDIDVRLNLADMGDFRAHIAQQYHGASIALRSLPPQIPTLQALNLPPIMTALLANTQGLILVTGATGSGKSTSLAGMIHQINQTEPKHIITLEDPIERYHRSLLSLVQQREIGRDCMSFAQGLHAAMRQDPDVMMIGELRDLASIRMALTAAETGHLVLATLHTASASQAIDRMIDVFPATEKPLVQGMLSQSLLAVLYQQLVVIASGERVALHELLIATPAVRNLIREGKTAQIPMVIQTGQTHGMQTLEQSLRRYQT